MSDAPRTGPGPAALRPVIAALANDGQAVAVARAAARVAAERGLPLHFVHVTPHTPPGQISDDSDTAVFDAVLRSAKGRPGFHFSYEAVVGEPLSTLLGRTSRAAVLVIGQADPLAREALDVALVAGAGCPVVIVPRTPQGALPADVVLAP